MKRIVFIFTVFLFQTSYSQQIAKIGTGVIPITPVHTFAWNDSIILRGNFSTLPDNTPSDGLAYWDGFHWKDLSLNTYSDGRVYLVYEDKLLMGGLLSFRSNVANLPLLQLNGNSWNNVYGVTSSNSLGSINDMIIYKNELYVAGQLQRIGGKYVKNIAKWDGVTWTDVGGGCGGSVNEINSLAILNNELYVGGFFDIAGTKVAKNVAKWDGTSWFALDSGVHQGAVSKIVAFKNKLIVMGGFTQAGSITHLSKQYKGRAIWDGANWIRMTGFAELAYEYAIQEYRGELFMGTYMNSRNHTINDTVMMSWDGTNYTNRLGADAEIIDISVVNDRLIITGDFNNLLTTSVSKMASYLLDPVGVANTKVNLPLFNIYPNPTTSQLNISNLSNYKNIRISIRNSLSSEVKEMNVDFTNNDCTFSMEGLPFGVYFIQFFDRDTLIDTQKFVVL